MDGKFIALVGALLVLGLAYAPIVWIVYRYVRFRPAVKIIYAITAGPVFIALLILNIALAEQFWPGPQQLLRQADVLRNRGKVALGVLSLCAIAVVGSWLWYRLFVWLDRLLNWESPSS